jgi:hypothetical protein
MGKLILYLGAGAALLGVGFVDSPGVGFGCALMGLIAGLILVYTPPADRKFVGVALLLALSLMIALASLYQAYLFTGGLPLFAPDGEGFSKFGWYISRVLLGQDTSVVPSVEHTYWNYDLLLRAELHGALPPLKYQTGPYTYFLGLLYAIFGYAPLLGRLINIGLLVASAFLIMRVAEGLSGNRGARGAFLLALFWPSMVLFSLSLLRDSAIVFAIVLVVWALYRVSHRKAFSLVAMVGGVVILGLLRPQASWLLLVVLGSWVIWRLLRLKRTLLVVAVVGVLMMGVGQQRQWLKETIIWRTVFQHIGFLNSEGITYNILPERLAHIKDPRMWHLRTLSWAEMVLICARGMAHYLTEPWPSHLVTAKLRAFFPQMVIWYACLAIAVPGGRAVLRERGDFGGFMLIFFAIFVSVSGMSEGNIGILIRHRDMVTPVVILLAAAGTSAVFGRLALQWRP